MGPKGCHIKARARIQFLCSYEISVLSRNLRPFRILVCLPTWFRTTYEFNFSALERSHFGWGSTFQFETQKTHVWEGEDSPTWMWRGRTKVSALHFSSEKLALCVFTFCRNGIYLRISSESSLAIEKAVRSSPPPERSRLDMIEKVCLLFNVSRTIVQGGKSAFSRKNCFCQLRVSLGK